MNCRCHVGGSPETTNCCPGCQSAFFLFITKGIIHFQHAVLVISHSKSAQAPRSSKGMCCSLLLNSKRFLADGSTMEAFRCVGPSSTREELEIPIISSRNNHVGSPAKVFHHCVGRYTSVWVRCEWFFYAKLMPHSQAVEPDPSPFRGVRCTTTTHYVSMVV